jgi:hypothetical protein
MTFEPQDPTEDHTIPRLGEIEKQNRTRRPNLWNPPASKMEIPKMSKEIEGTAANQLALLQTTYTELLFSVGEKKYGLRRDSDFTVDVFIPEGTLIPTLLEYKVIGGPIVHVILPVCSIENFEGRIHRILRDVKIQLRSKAVELMSVVKRRDKELKLQVPTFATYDALDGHKLEIVQEQIVTITDKTTGAVVSRVKPEKEEAFRIMIHRAKLELIVHNKLIKEVEKQQKEGNISYAKQPDTI